MAKRKRNHAEPSSSEEDNSRKVCKDADINEKLLQTMHIIESLQTPRILQTTEKVYGLCIDSEANFDSKKMGSPSLFWIASSIGNVKVVKLLMKSKGVNIDQANENKDTPLMVACQNGHYNLVRILLKANAITDAENDNGWTALHFAAHGGHADIIEALVKCNEAIINKKTKNERSALYIAAAQGHCEAVKKLLPLTADLKQMDRFKKFTVLHAAAERGHSDALEILLQNEDLKSVINLGDGRWNRTPLLLASWKGNIKCVQLLCSLQANVSKKTKGGYTPMHWAAALGRTEIIQILYKESADISAVNEAKETPLDLAKRGHRSAAVALLKHYAAMQDTLVTATKEGNITEVKSLLECVQHINFKCQSYDRPAGIEALECDHSEILRTLSNNTYLINCSWKDIALLLASYEGNVSKVSHLLDSGANINTATEQGWTPLMIASESGNEYVVQHLISRGADVHAVTEWKQSALLFAAWGNYGTILEMLITAGANVNLTTNGGWTAYQWALALDHETAKLVLEKYNALKKANKKSTDSLDELRNRNGIVLKIQDHDIVFGKTRGAFKKWREIGRELYFSMTELDEITREPGRHCDTDFYEAMLMRWMEKTVATAEQLSAALRSHYVGKEVLANTFFEEMKKIRCSRV